MRYFFLLTLSFLFNIHFGFAQQTQNDNILKVEALTIQNGLSQSTINDILEDRDGFLWIATNDGLNRYDGQKFVIYKHIRSDSTTIPDNEVRTIHEDKNGKIWIGTASGLCVYDKNTNQFKTYSNNQQNKNSLINNYVTAIEEDKDFIWIGTQKGLSKFDAKKEIFTNYFVTEKDSLLLGSNEITRLLIDNQNQLWIGTKRGLNVWTADRKPQDLFRSSSLENNTALLNDYINSIHQDTKNRIWVGTNECVHLYNPSSIDFQHFLLPNNKKYDVYDIKETQNGEIWASSKNLICKINPQSISASDYTTSISIEEIQMIYSSKNGTVWIGTRDAGVFKYSSLANRFRLYKPEENNKNSLVDRKVWTILKDKEGIVWVGTNEAVSRIDRNKSDSNQDNYYSIFEGKNETDYQGKGAYFILETKDNKKWFTIKKNILRMDSFSEKEGGKFSSLLSNSSDSNSVNGVLLDMHQDSKNTIWLASFKGILKLVPTNITKENKLGYTTKAYLKDTQVWHIFEDSKNIIWLSTNKGVVKMLRNEQNEPTDFVFYSSDPKDITSISSNNIRAMTQDSKGNLWIATNNGLNRMDKKTQTFEHWGERNEAANYAMYGILTDENDNIWLSTNRGILKFLNDKKSQNLADDRRVIVYDTRDGLQSLEFNSGAFFKADDGEMFFGGIEGFNSFYPKDIQPSTEKRKVILTELKLFGENIKVNQETEKRILLPKALNNLEELNLTYQDKIFTLEFVSPNFNKPEYDTYLYKLEGFDKNWNKTTTIQQATYTNLPAGEYIFRVKVINGDNIESEEKTLKINVLPPFWKTWWFISLCGLAIVGISFGIYKRKIYSIQVQNTKLEGLVEQRTFQLKEKNDEVIAQNYSITLKNKNISSSINYASLIQKAMLPPMEEIKNAFESVFVLWLPRDVVSGDFYWFAKLEDKICIAAVDCTGHGVPGAFMSMIGNDMLNHIVLEKKITNPSLILSNLHNQVLTALRQSETQNRDGMDMALCVYDTKTNQLEFAGAKNPLYYVQNKELKQIEGSKSFIGGHWNKTKNERNFETHTLQIDQPTTFFLCTDGYQDQFGGKEGRKLMKKKMKELFVEIADLEDNKQKEKLENYFLDWKTDKEQIDDVLVMGFKVGNSNNN